MSHQNQTASLYESSNITCNICDKPGNENDILKCKCGLTVHQFCTGLIGENPFWMCKNCTAYIINPKRTPSVSTVSSRKRNQKRRELNEECYAKEQEMLAKERELFAKYISEKRALDEEEFEENQLDDDEFKTASVVEEWLSNGTNGLLQASKTNTTPPQLSEHVPGATSRNTNLPVNTLLQSDNLINDTIQSLPITTGTALLLENNRNQSANQLTVDANSLPPPFQSLSQIEGVGQYSLVDPTVSSLSNRISGPDQLVPSATFTRSLQHGPQTLLATQSVPGANSLLPQFPNRPHTFDMVQSNHHSQASSLLQRDKGVNKPVQPEPLQRCYKTVGDRFPVSSSHPLPLVCQGASQPFMQSLQSDNRVRGMSQSFPDVQQDQFRIHERNHHPDTREYIPQSVTQGIDQHHFNSRYFPIKNDEKKQQTSNRNITTMPQFDAHMFNTLNINDFENRRTASHSYNASMNQDSGPNNRPDDPRALSNGNILDLCNHSNIKQLDAQYNHCGYDYQKMGSIPNRPATVTFDSRDINHSNAENNRLPAAATNGTVKFENHYKPTDYRPYLGGCSNGCSSTSFGLSAEQMAARKTVSKELPKFSGRPDEWQFFICSFEQTTLICGLSDAENLIRLRSSLQGEALEAVRNRLQIPKDVPGAIESLRLLYGTPELVINSVLKKIRKEPPPRHDKRETMIKFAVSVQDLCVTMVNSNMADYLNNPMLLQELVTKLPENIKYDWAKYRASQTGTVTIKTFELWILEITRALSSVSINLGLPDFSRQKSSTSVPNNKNNGKGYVNAHDQKLTKDNPKISACLVCGGTCIHIQQCSKFVAMSYNEKWTSVKKNQLCRCCLKTHGYRCDAFKKCGTNGCQFKHHPILHKPSVSTTESAESHTKKGPTTTQLLTHRDINQSVLFRVVPIILYGPNTQVKTHAFLDDGSSLTLIEKSVADELDLQGEHEPLCLKWTANTHRMENDSKKISMQISGTRNPDKKFKIVNAHTVESLNLPTQTLAVEDLQYSCPHLRGIPVESYSEVSPRILIGIDNLNLSSPLSCREGQEGQPVAIKSRLGWSVCGPCQHTGGTRVSNTYNFHMCECKHDDNMEHMMKEYFSLESMGVSKTGTTFESTEDIRARQILEKTTIRNGDRFESGLLWKFDSVNLPNSYPMAKNRLNCLNNKMAKNPELAATLQKQIQDHIAKGYVRELAETEINDTVPYTWYLPIFPVQNLNKPGKCRLVWDAAAKVNGVSLNSVLLKGPDQLVSLPSVLYKFRERKIAICADIQEMFLQIGMKKEDQQAQRFLWQMTDDDKPKTYVMQVLTFGSSSSPCTAHYVKNKNAKLFEDQYPRAVQSIIENHYVDDLLDSVDSVDEAIQLATDVKFIHKSGGFHIRNWISNSEEVVTALGESVVEKNKNLNISPELATEKVLGMLWNTTSDSFCFKLNENRIKDGILSGVQRPTKREILRIVMMVFDPLGLLAQFMIYAKILLQHIWLAKLDWDEPLNDELFEKWRHWAKYLPSIEQIRIPRCYLSILSLANENNIELHIFVDASRDAFAAAAYYRVENEIVECSLISAKTRVAPLKLLSVPRLELEGAILGVRLANNISQSHSIKPSKRFFWTDSKTVLSWIRSDHRKYRQFVAFRVSEILESTDIKEWRYVPTGLNVADDATKWQKHPIFESESRWYRGPDFLYQCKEQWPPDCARIETTEEELRPQLHQSATVVAPILTLHDFSTWKSLRRRMMLVLRFPYNIRAKRDGVPKRTGVFERDEYREAEILLYKQVQRECYFNDIVLLETSRDRSILKTGQVKKSSSIFPLNPCLDEFGLLRSQGRIDAAPGVAEFAKRPIIMPRDHHVTKLIIQFFHMKYHHQNNETVTNEVRQVFSISNLRVEIKKVVKSCQWCKIKAAHPDPPMMAKLPPARLQSFARPFSFIGIDYFGPMLVKIGRRVEKRWGMLITCLTVRAIHVEVAHSLSTDSCILCLRNFMARRGTPIEIFSDNGTNFKGASRELQEALQEVDQNKLAREFSSPNTKWRFIPPGAPHMGGSWERMVQSVKKTLSKIIVSRTPSDELLQSMLIEVENIVNSRPLTYLPLDSDQDEALTPNHLLLGSSNGIKPISEFNDENAVLRQNWLDSQRYANIFWKRWLVEYLPTITRRSKWMQPVKPIEVGDLVIIVDDQNPRNCWPRGKVIQTTSGSDGQVRRATVQTANGIYERPAVKLAVLDVGNISGKPTQLAIPEGSVSTSAEC